MSTTELQSIVGRSRLVSTDGAAIVDILPIGLGRQLYLRGPAHGNSWDSESRIRYPLRVHKRYWSLERVRAETFLIAG